MTTPKLFRNTVDLGQRRRARTLHAPIGQEPAAQSGISLPADRMVMLALTLARDRQTGLRIPELIKTSGLPAAEVRHSLKTLLELSPPWVDGDVDPNRGMVWWLTAAGAFGAKH